MKKIKKEKKIVIPEGYCGHPKFYEIVENLKKFHSEKNRQYATKTDPLGNFRRVGFMCQKLFKPGIDPALAVALILEAKQIDGVFEIVGEQKKNTIDSVYDKLTDKAVYSILQSIIVWENELRDKKKK